MKPKSDIDINNFMYFNYKKLDHVRKNYNIQLIIINKKIILKIKLHAFNINENVDIKNIKKDIDNINDNESSFDSKKE